MRKASVLKLQFGDYVYYGASKKQEHDRIGKVLFVTKNGGVKMQEDGGFEFWVPYHHITRKIDDSFDLRIIGEHGMSKGRSILGN
jgi:hypothetical protein